MDARLTDEQRMLVDASTRFVETQWPVGRIREHDVVAADHRRAAAELGWFGLLVPSELGGGSLSDNPVVDCALVGRVTGAGLQPGNFVPTNVVAQTLAEVGSAAHHATVLPTLTSGAAAATWAAGAAEGDLATGSGVLARREGEGFVLNGLRLAVPEVRNSDWMLVPAATADAGPTQLLVPTDADGVGIVDLEGLDVTRDFADVEFTDVRLGSDALVGAWGAAEDTIERQLQIACVLTVAEMVGAMGRDFALALDYAKTRIAFGRPIGSFQAIKHLLADTSLLLEMSDAMLFAAARALGRGDADAARVVAMAKAFVSDNGVELVHNCFQVFGGVGFTWEHDQHLYLRRVTTDATRYGDATWHRERFCQFVGL